jgi:hypothetical protein
LLKEAVIVAAKLSQQWNRTILVYGHIFRPWMSVPAVMRLEGQYFWGLPIGHVAAFFDAVEGFGSL